MADRSLADHRAFADEANVPTAPFVVVAGRALALFTSAFLMLSLIAVVAR